MIKVRYFYSACVGIETEDVSVLCDPWFSEGAFDGSWYHYPPFTNAVNKIPKYDYIYISHIHSDHYDPEFLKQYLEKYPNTKVIIGDFKPNFLSKRMSFDGDIQHQICENVKVGDTEIHIILNNGDDPFDLDSALVVTHKGHSVVNMNDNFYNEQQIEKIKSICGKPTIALLPYTGAGAYPQTYHHNGEILRIRANEKKQNFFQRYLRLKEALQPQVCLPFAGKYVLAGKLTTLNEHRGVADAVEVKEFDPSAVVLEDGGEAWIDTENLVPSEERKEKYNQQEIAEHLKIISQEKMDYEIYFKDLPLEKIPFHRLLPKAYTNALKVSKVTHDHYFCLKLEKNWFVFNANKNKMESSFEESVDSFSPRSELAIDSKYLYGLITSIFHWNNAEVGSQYMTRREPDIFDRDVQLFMSFFHL